MGMNDCKDILEKLSPFIDNELPSQDRELVERHLSQCSACRREEFSLRKINDLLDSMPEESPTPTFTVKTVHRAASWMQCDYVKEHLFRPAVTHLFSVVSLLYFESGRLKKRSDPSYRHLRNFDDFPPESFSSFYMELIQEESN